MGVVCSICLTSEKVTFEDKALGLYRCSACGHVFKKIDVSGQEKYGDDYFLKVHKNWFNNPDYALFEFIHKKIAELKGGMPLNVLDVGCGKGAFLRFLKNRNPKMNLYGIDVTDNEDRDIHFIKGDIITEDIAMKFDVICNLAVIEHIDSPHAFVKKMRGLLAPDGILFTVTDNDGSLIYKCARLANKMGIDGAYKRLYLTHHLHCFSERSIMRLMELNGFEPIFKKNYSHPVEAVDYPDTNLCMMTVYRLAVRAVFLFANACDKGILQIVICKPKGKLISQNDEKTE